LKGANASVGFRSVIRGLYAVTPDLSATGELVRRVEAAIVGGACAVQYRNKTAGEALRREQAGALLAVCRSHRVPFIINDHLALALALGADGVHLGATDGSVAEARAALGPGVILGASCYNALQDAIAAEQAGADYVAFGSFFPSGVKPGAVRAAPNLLREARRTLSVPVVAIGGITAENAAQLVVAGADAVAVISALFAVGDTTRAARQFSDLFKA
jgi:thiamine-phosphate pyrophosphorylase